MPLSASQHPGSITMVGSVHELGVMMLRRLHSSTRDIGHRAMAGLSRSHWL